MGLQKLKLTKLDINKNALYHWIEGIEMYRPKWMTLLRDYRDPSNAGFAFLIIILHRQFYPLLPCLHRLRSSHHHEIGFAW